MFVRSLPFSCCSRCAVVVGGSPFAPLPCGGRCPSSCPSWGALASACASAFPFPSLPPVPAPAPAVGFSSPAPSPACGSPGACLSCPFFPCVPGCG